MYPYIDVFMYLCINLPAVDRVAAEVVAADAAG